ncbi:alpha/beta hydrolase [Subtercola sp. YIM 133946]|uniref:alpha/beta hydrolase n=1 Tax=Subtercola sp. YIM 133946 TaxID=3118909 RepID=UPI002F93BFCC
MSIEDLPPAPPMPPTFRAPGAADTPAAPVGARSWWGLVYSAIAGYRELELDVHVPTGHPSPVGLVVWMHGGAWLFGSRVNLPEYWPEGSLFQSLIDAGLAVASIDYRHSREAPFPAQLHDAKAAVRYLRAFADDFGIDPDRIGVWGESAGGHLAALVALTGDIAELEGDDGIVGPSSAVSAIVDFYGVSNLVTMPSLLESFPPEWITQLEAMGGDLPPDPMQVLLAGSPLPEAQRATSASPVTWISPNAPPFLLVHGDADTVVPHAQSTELHERLTASGIPVELVTVAGADHVFVGADPVPLIELGTAFLRRHLGTR